MVQSRTLTELEGAVLTEVGGRGNDTAYKVRRAFQTSPSSHWRGSAGAVSPAIRRLVALGYLAADPHDSRNGLRLSITDKGAGALNQWAADVDTACGVGFDPFRLRCGLWQTLPRDRRKVFFRSLEEALEKELRKFEQRLEGDSVDRIQTELAVALQISRLYWVRRQLSGQ
jgi:DNA-binding PadR family transcriptional regulator